MYWQLQETFWKTLKYQTTRNQFLNAWLWNVYLTRITGYRLQCNINTYCELSCKIDRYIEYCKKDIVSFLTGIFEAQYIEGGRGGSYH